MSAILPTEVDLDYVPLFSVLDEPDETDTALKRLTDWDWEDGDDSFAGEEDLFPLQEFKSLGSRLFESNPISPLSPLKDDVLYPASSWSSSSSELPLPQTEKRLSSNGSSHSGGSGSSQSTPSATPTYRSLERAQGSRGARPKQFPKPLPPPRHGSLKPQPPPKDAFYHDIGKNKLNQAPSFNNFNLQQQAAHVDYNKPGTGHKGISSFLTSPPRGNFPGTSSFSSASSSSSSGSVVSPDRNSGSSYMTNVTTPVGSLHRRRPLKLVCDIDSTLMGPAVYPPFRVSQDTVARVSFPSSTWDTMMRNFCIALETNSVFMCDKFLGSRIAEGLYSEMEYLKACGVFERHLFRPNSSSVGPYASVFLLEEEDVHRKVDGLALMVYKLARYYTARWSRLSVQLSHFPAGQPPHRARGNPRLATGRVLKCIYFPNRQTGLHPDEGLIKIRTNSKVFRIEPVFDRLVAFWCDALEHKVTFSSTESYLVSMWLVV